MHRCWVAATRVRCKVAFCPSCKATSLPLHSLVCQHKTRKTIKEEMAKTGKGALSIFPGISLLTPAVAIPRSPPVPSGQSPHLLVPIGARPCELVSQSVACTAVSASATQSLPILTLHSAPAKSAKKLKLSNAITTIKLRAFIKLAQN